MALYGDPRTRNADLVYGDGQKTPFSMGIQELNFSKEERICSSDHCDISEDFSGMEVDSDYEFDSNGGEFTEDETDSDEEEESNCQVDLEDG